MIFFLPSIIPALVYVSSYQNMLAVGGPQDEIWNAIFGVRFPPLLSQADTATNTITIPAADVAGTLFCYGRQDRQQGPVQLGDRNGRDPQRGVHRRVLGAWIAGSTKTVEDVVVISSASKVCNPEGGNSTATVPSAGAAVYKTNSECLAAIDISKFDASIWTKTDAGILFGDTLVVEA